MKTLILTLSLFCALSCKNPSTVIEYEHDTLYQVITVERSPHPVSGLYVSIKSDTLKVYGKDSLYIKYKETFAHGPFTRIDYDFYIVEGKKFVISLSAIDGKYSLALNSLIPEYATLIYKGSL